MSYNINQNVEKFIVLMNPANISTSDQSCFNVVDQRWKNVDPTLIQRWYNVSARRWNSVEITLMQRFFNLASTLVKPILNQIGLVVIVDCVIVMHVKYMMVFILLNEKVFFYYILTIEVLMKYKKKISKNKKTVVHIAIHSVGNNADIHRSLKCCIQNYKTSQKNLKI